MCAVGLCRVTGTRGGLPSKGLYAEQPTAVAPDGNVWGLVCLLPSREMEGFAPDPTRCLAIRAGFTARARRRLRVRLWIVGRGAESGGLRARSEEEDAPDACALHDGRDGLSGGGPRRGGGVGLRQLHPFRSPLFDSKPLLGFFLHPRYTADSCLVRHLLPVAATS